MPVVQSCCFPASACCSCPAGRLPSICPDLSPGLLPQATSAFPASFSFFLTHQTEVQIRSGRPNLKPTGSISEQMRSFVHKGLSSPGVSPSSSQCSVGREKFLERRPWLQALHVVGELPPQEALLIFYSLMLPWKDLFSALQLWLILILLLLKS